MGARGAVRGGEGGGASDEKYLANRREKINVGRGIRMILLRS